MSKTRFVIPAVLALAATLAGGVAHARSPDVQWSVTIGSPGYPQHRPVYGAPVPVYGVPVPIYGVPAPVYRPVVPVYRQPVPVYPVARYHGPTHWDRDGDGIPNRHDRHYNPSWDRDGDGIPNHRDRHYNPHGDRDRDGVPNRWDRHDRDWRR
jgi:hypothetical protein